MAGVTSVNDTPKGSKFVTFDTVENAQSAFETLNESDVRVKYSHYKMYFQIKEFDDEEVSYDGLKVKVIDAIKDADKDAEVLYFRNYKKSDKLTGCGVVTFDTIDTLNKLVTKREIDMGDDTINCYRFNLNRSGRGDRNFRSTSGRASFSA